MRVGAFGTVHSESEWWLMWNEGVVSGATIISLGDHRRTRWRILTEVASHPNCGSTQVGKADELVKHVSSIEKSVEAAIGTRCSI